MKHSLAILTLCNSLCFFGCNTETVTSKPPVAKQAKTIREGYIWEREERPYKVTEVDGKYTSMVQHRYAWVVFPFPDEKQPVEEAAREIYQELKANIENAGPSAQYKMIMINLFDRDAICPAILHVSHSAGPAIPNWEDAKLDWHWKNPQTRPPMEHITIYDDYQQRMAECRKVAEAPYCDGDGILQQTSDNIIKIDQQVELLRTDVVQQMSADLKMTPTEFTELTDAVLYWDFTTAE